MLDLIATLAYVSFVLVTATLVWAARELAETVDQHREWKPGTNPHGWRF